jgi:hypothetical protein
MAACAPRVAGRRPRFRAHAEQAAAEPVKQDDARELSSILLND